MMQMKRRFYMLKWFQEKHATPVLINSKLVWEGLGGETDLGNWCRVCLEGGFEKQ